MTCLQKVERTLDVLEISQIKKPGLVLAADEEVPDFEISVANFFCSMAVTNSMQDQIYVTKKLMRWDVRMHAFLIFRHQPPLNDPNRKL